MSIIAIILGVAAAASFVLWTRTGRTRPNGEVYHLIPGPYGWFLLVSALVVYFWPSIQDGPVGPHTGLFIAGWVLAALVVAVAPFVGAVAVTAVVAIVAMLVGPVAPVIAAEVNGAPSSTSASPTNSPSPTVEPTASPEAQVATTPADIPEVYPERYLNILRDNGYTIENIDGKQVPAFQAKSTKRYDDKRKAWIDAVCLPVANREAVLAMILGSPDCAAQVASGLYRLPVIGLDGKTRQLNEHSPWLAQFKDPSGLNDWAEAAMASEGTERIEYANRLILIAMQVEAYADAGVQKGRETNYNFHVTDRLRIDEAKPWDTIPEFALSPVQYKGDFVVFKITYKGHDGCWSEFGINIGDGRFAGFTCETPKPVATPPTSTPPPTTTTPPTGPPRTTPPPTKECVKPDKPGKRYTWNQEKCAWEPPVDQCVKGNPPGADWTWDQAACKWNPPADKCVKPDKPAGEWKWDEKACKWVKIDKPDEKNPTQPPAVTPTTQPDPIESKAPKPKDPIVPSEKPGDPIPPKEDKPAVPVPDNEDHPKPKDPPKKDEPNNPQPDKPGDEIPDPDAPAPAGALLVLVPLAAEGFRRWVSRRAA